MSSVDVHYESARPGGYIASEPKICELCGGNFYRIIGSANKYCKPCHANWDEAISQASSRKHNTRGA